MVITAPYGTSSEDASTHLELKGVSMTQTLYTRYAETDAQNIVQRIKGHYPLMYVGLALLVFGIALVAGSPHLDLAAWDDPSKFTFPMP
jgi:hypothetical protein